MPTDTAEDQSPSSRNALTHGLFAVRYFIRQGEEDEYAETLTSVIAELAPDGLLEEAFAAEIVGATWRLRRCRMVEYSLSEGATLDPMVDDVLEKRQKSVDRARDQSHNILRRSLAELRKLQAERALREQAAESRQAEDRDLIDALLKEIDQESPGEPAEPAPPAESPFCKPPQQTPRNADCPCGSGTKYKRCCGKDAPPVLNPAA
jgi:hypothetical protein